MSSSISYNQNMVQFDEDTYRVGHSHENLENLKLKEMSLHELHALFQKVAGDLAVFKDFYSINPHSKSNLHIYNRGIAIAEDELLLKLISERITKAMK